MSVNKTNPSLDRTTALQSKLHQAAKCDPHRRFHALYDKLYLPYVLQSAWQLVRENGGAPGSDQQTLEAIEQQGVEPFLAEIAEALREQQYRPQPVRRVLIPKGDGRPRPLGIPTVRDRVVQAAAKLLLEPIFEADFEGTPSFGFRPELGPPGALTAVRTHSNQGFRWVVDADIEQFFDTLEHQHLMTALRRRISDGEMLRLIYRWLKAGYLLDGEYHDTDQGSPQGGVLSPLLANVYLHGLDRAQQQQKAFVGRLVRYADDFVMQCGTQAHAECALVWVREQLAVLGLRLHPEKTRVVNDREGFDFLGFHHRRVPLRRRPGVESRGVLRWPNRKACQRFRERLRRVLGTPRQTREEWSARMAALTRYLTGWCQYYRQGESARVFRKLDEHVRERVARHRARGQPSGKKRRRRHWSEYLEILKSWEQFPSLERISQGKLKDYRGRMQVRWRAV